MSEHKHTYYSLERRGKNGQWYRDDAEWESEAEVREEMSEIIDDAKGRWRIVEITVIERIVTTGQVSE